MSATEKLRALLDERCVEHYDGTERTLWGYERTGEDTGIYRFAASEISGGYLQFDMFRVTPVQAIAATLGCGECEDTWGYDPYAAFRCSECGAMHTASDKRVIRFCYNCGRRVKGGAE